MSNQNPTEPTATGGSAPPPEPLPSPLPTPKDAAEFERLARSWPRPATAQEWRAFSAAFAPLQNAPPLPRTGTVRRGVPMGRTGQHGHALRGDVFEPPAAFARPAPVLVYLHGGGWVCGSPATYHKLLAHFAARGFVVVAPDYPLAPEHPCPAAEDACLAAALWAKENAPAFGGDATSMMVAGDSAGAWLAVRLAAATEGIGLFSSAALLYGWFDASEAALADLARRDAGFAQSLAFMARAYLGSGAQRSVFEEFRHLPPTMVVFGALDPLAGQSEAAAAALAAHANDEDADGLLVVPGVGHGFLQCDLFAATTPTLDAVAAFLHGPGG